MKNYVEEKYEVDQTIFDQLHKVLPETTSTEQRTYQRGDILNIAETLSADFDIHDKLHGMPGLGGCLTVKEWAKVEEDTQVKTILKHVLIDFVKKEYHQDMFLLVVWDIICQIQTERQLKSVCPRCNSTDISPFELDNFKCNSCNKWSNIEDVLRLQN